jgi:hypothetical protein
MAKMVDTQTFSDVEAEWYDKLKTSGFEDIEKTSDPNRPLTRWHSFDLVSERLQNRKITWEVYERRVEIFTNSKDFTEIINLICKHGNSIFGEVEITSIWEMHRNGHTERGIAAEMECSKSCIHFLLHRIRAWMKLV